LSQDSQSFIFSVLVHSAAIVVLSAGLMDNPPIIEPAGPTKDSIRLVEMHMPDMKKTVADKTSDLVPPILNTSSAGKRQAQPQADSPSQAAFRKSPALRTLIQPNLAKLEIPQDLMVPSLLVWSPENPSTKEVVLQPPQVNLATHTVSSIARPNEEKLLSDVAVTSSALSTNSTPVLPSNTSPIVIRGPQPAQHAPETASMTTKPPAGTTVLSVSDLQMKDGTVVLPRVNEVASAEATKTPGLMGGSSQSPATGSSQVVTKDGSGTGTGTGLSTSRIMPPKDGKFGLVVIGASPQDDYPEAAGVWNGRLVYTVYLHVGTAKSWILQFAQPRTEEIGATGTASSLQSPWPTDMVVPNLGAGAINADALLVHGFLNKTGRFQDLAVVFPAQCAMAKFLLNALEQWEFRPAAANGVATAIEVLLIIPQQD
jgi:hypothetical protein